MIDRTISPLRRRMIEDMTMRKLAPKTQATYTTMAPWPPRPATSQDRRSVTITAAEKRQACRPPTPATAGVRQSFT